MPTAAGTQSQSLEVVSSMETNWVLEETHRLSYISAQIIVQTKKKKKKECKAE